MADQRSSLIDPQAAQRWQLRPAAPSPWLHEEVARRMQERLDLIRLQPSSWAHWGSVGGGLQAHALLVRRYPKATCFVVESEPARQRHAARQLTRPWWQRMLGCQPSTQFASPGKNSVQMLWANMALHMVADPQAIMRQWHEALAVDGFLMFSCLGPDSLQELRQLYRELGWPAPAHEFTDMHDWGDRLLQVGFAQPVVDMEHITLTFDSVEQLLLELRGLGRNLHPERFAALRGRHWSGQLQQALASKPLQLTFEIIYGHAIKPPARLDVSSHSEVSLDDMRAKLARRRNQFNEIKR